MTLCVLQVFVTYQFSLSEAFSLFSFKAHIIEPDASFSVTVTALAHACSPVYDHGNIWRADSSNPLSPMSQNLIFIWLVYFIFFMRPMKRHSLPGSVHFSASLTIFFILLFMTQYFPEKIFYLLWVCPFGFLSGGRSMMSTHDWACSNPSLLLGVFGEHWVSSMKT